MKLRLSIIIILLATINSLNAQLVINEVCAANYDDYQGTAGDYEDWFEIYNMGATDVDIDSYYISDDILNPTLYQVTGSATVPAGGYLVVYASGNNVVNGTGVHTNFKITQEKQEYAVLSDPGGTVIDAYWLEFSNQKNHSFGRGTDGGADWKVFTNPTPGAANNGGFDGYAETPTFDMPAGNYAGSVTVNISIPAGTTVHYTLDGTSPTQTSPTVSGSITVNDITVVRARAFSSDPNLLPSFIETNTYFIDVSHALKVISISGDEVTDFINDAAPGAFTDNFEGSMEYFDENLTLVDEGLGDYNKHGNDSWGYDQRGIDFIMRDQFGYNNGIHDEIFDHSSRDEFQRLIIKAAANDNYPASGGAHIRDAYIHELSIRAELSLDERSYEPCIMYVDGEYWGVYELREKADDLDYTLFYYNQGNPYVEYLKTWGGTWQEYGTDGEDSWEALVNFITTNNMTDDANYDYVTSQLNTKSLIDYFILNSYVVSSDWLNWNTAWWRGLNPDGDHKKWGYVLWDLDASFDHYINYTGVPSTDPDADPCNPETLGDPGGQGHVPIVNALFQNENFYQDYVSRFADLSAGALSCESMHAILDELTDRIEPEMQGQVDRWGGTVVQWQANVQEIHDFIDERCDAIAEGIVDCYDVEGPFEVMVDVFPPGAGWVEFNSIDITTFPWTGQYFGGLDVDLEANAYGVNVFSHWEINNHVISDLNSETASFTFAQSDTIIAHFVSTTTELTLNVSPTGAGDITYASNTYNTFPTTVDVPEGGNTNLETSALGNFYEFDHWELQYGTIVSDPTDDEVTINTDQPDVLTAFYNELPNFNITVDAQGTDDGIITFNGDTIDAPFGGQFLGDVEYFITATPPEHWHFVYWILNNNILISDSVLSSNSFFLSADDVLIAVFEEDPNVTVTFKVEPPNGGDLTLNGVPLMELPHTEKFYVEDFAIDLFCEEEPFYNFMNWHSENHNLGVNNQTSLSMVLQFDDTITANLYAEPFGFWLPNSFTPNDDGINDLYKPKGNAVDIDEYQIKIYDRYGAKVFESIDMNEGWNGDGINKEGYFSPIGVYTYVVNVKSAIDGELHTFKGIINLIR